MQEWLNLVSKVRRFKDCSQLFALTNYIRKNLHREKRSNTFPKLIDTDQSSLSQITAKVFWLSSRNYKELFDLKMFKLPNRINYDKMNNWLARIARIHDTTRSLTSFNGIKDGKN